MKEENMLALILEGDRRFTESIDPDGITGRGRLARLCVNLDESTWTARYRSPEGEDTVLLGRFFESLVPMVDTIMVKSGERGYEEYRFPSSETLGGGLSTLKEVPESLRKRKTDSGKGYLPFTMDEYLSAVDNAALWNMELHDEREPLRLFTRYMMTYTYGDGHTKASLRLICPLPEGEIYAECQAVEKGIGSRKAVMRKNLGMNKTATASCTVRDRNRDVPSLKAAFDLYAAIPMLYGNPRKMDIIKRP